MAKQRLIDAEALKNKVIEQKSSLKTRLLLDKDFITEIKIVCFIKLLKIIENVPTIEAKPVVHAHWEYHGGDDDMELYGFCSYCGKGRLTEDDILRLKPLLCPYCGAQMDKKEGRHETL